MTRPNFKLHLPPVRNPGIKTWSEETTWEIRQVGGGRSEEERGGRGAVAGSCEHGNESSVSIKRRKFLDKLSDCQLLKKDSAPFHFPLIRRYLHPLHSPCPSVNKQASSSWLTSRLFCRFLLSNAGITPWNRPRLNFISSFSDLVVGDVTERCFLLNPGKIFPEFSKNEVLRVSMWRYSYGFSATPTAHSPPLLSDFSSHTTQQPRVNCQTVHKIRFEGTNSLPNR
jgi:hypothetical protein